MSPLEHDAADTPITLNNLHNEQQQHYKHHNDSGQRMPLVDNIAVQVSAACLFMIVLFALSFFMVWFLDMLDGL
jgi:hypothetical protein